MREKEGGRREKPAGAQSLRAATTLLAAILLLAGCGGGGEVAIEDAPGTVRIAVSDGAGQSEEVVVELATTQEERSQGLMNRRELADDAGMLFVFEGMVHTAFWMKDTYVPLDIAFLGEDGRVQEILAGEPLDEELLQPALPYRYTLEVNQGWFARHGLGVGARVTIPDDVREGAP